MKKCHQILLYGNCQLALLSNWLNQFDHIKIIRPKEYGISTDEIWKNSVWFPADTGLHNLMLALKRCNYFIFQDITNQKFIKSVDLYKSDTICKKLCITNMYFGCYRAKNQQELHEMIEENTKRQNTLRTQYSDDYLDTFNFVKRNWRKKLLLKADNHPNHPTSLYYKYLCTILCKKLPELNIEPINFLKNTHGLIEHKFCQEILERFPEIELPKDQP